jgi:hypothetical protein
MKRIKTFAMFEMIKVPIKVGDTVLGGRFKNKKIVVKKIGKNDKGDITINGKPLLKFRIVKENWDPTWHPSKSLGEEIHQLMKDCLQDLVDDGFNISTDLADFNEIRITKRGGEFPIRDVEKSIVDLASHLEGIGVGTNTIHYKIEQSYGMEDSMKAPQEQDDGWRTESLSSIDSLSDVEVTAVEIFLSQK